jgi:hypothetical protein
LYFTQENFYQKFAVAEIAIFSATFANATTCFKFNIYLGIGSGSGLGSGLV